MSDDVRLNLPSASGADIWMSCPAQPEFIKTLPPVTETPDETTLAGIRIHKALCYENPLELSEEDAATYQLAMKNQESLLQQWLMEKEIEVVSEGPREERLYFHDPDTMQAVTSGQIDRHWIAPPWLLIEDFKSQYCWNLTPSQRNKQLRVYAVLSWLEYDGINGVPINGVRVALNKPKIRAEPVDFTDYSRTDLEFSRMQILFELWETRQKDAQFRPGQHCNWCIGKRYCRTAGAMSLLPASFVDVSQPVKLSDDEAMMLVSRLSPQDARRLRDYKAIIEKILDANQQRLKGMTPEALADIGLMLGKATILRPIINTYAAFLKLRDEDKIPEDKLFMALFFGNKELTDVIRREVGMKEDGAVQFIRETLADYIQEKPCEAPLKEIK